VDTRSNPARREILSARSASRVLLEELWRWPWPVWGKPVPRWPSLIAVVERVEREVVPELGVPLSPSARGIWNTIKGYVRGLRRGIRV
jgi:hypothetical protein